jgi:hypothetical protein
MYSVIAANAETKEVEFIDRFETKAEAMKAKRASSKNCGTSVKFTVKEGNWYIKAIYTLSAETVAAYTEGRISRQIEVTVQDSRQHNWVEVSGIDNNKNAFAFNLVPAASITKTLVAAQY